ncbi:MAG: diacylglycerol kinase family lipid kinase [Clostridia bacterium]|nr:diacylglycerol kinase family lipid kinase [Clostridia bacterium]
MKTIFIINPCAGQGSDVEKLTSEIRCVSEQIKSDVEIYITKSVGDATEYVKNYCRDKGCARFIACGGDGTLNEVLNGAIGYDDAEIGVLPLGTGNDFCRNFPTDCNFSDITAQINGITQKCDSIKYTTEFEGEEKNGYCVNMFNIGFDANVADMTSNMKKKPLISGSLAYFLSILVMLIKKKGAELNIEIDGKPVHKGHLLLTSIANGCYCGGGVKSNPLADVSDGLININIIKNVSRIRFLTLLPGYMKGTFMSYKNIEKYISTLKCENVNIIPVSGKMRLCVDGEITDAQKTSFSILPKSFNFVIPAMKNTENTKERELVAMKKQYGIWRNYL